MAKLTFLNDNADFSVSNPEEVSYLYFPLAGEAGLKSSITPLLGGDSKISQNSFLLEPVSSENLHNNRSTRNFWIRMTTEDGAKNTACQIWSASGASAKQEADRFTPDQDESLLEAGLMWQKTVRCWKEGGLRAEITCFVPTDVNAEVMLVSIENTGNESKTIEGICAVPIYGRSADNIRDHRNVTSMLHRIHTGIYGIQVKPTMSFDERGHQPNHLTYYVEGVMEDGIRPEGFYPTVQSFLGEGGTFTHPRAVYEDMNPVSAGEDFAGTEAVGGLLFAPVTLEEGDVIRYVILAGIADTEVPEEELVERFGSPDKAEAELEKMKAYWQEKANIRFESQNKDYDRFLRWVSFQPVLRRIFGCSFLPHHDYGRGGRGWRDLWQDCLALILMDPADVRSMLVANYGGVRVDGTNATIIGDGVGEFIADRNGISRVWMDHAYWPLGTTKLYIDQTGDLDILMEKAPYFKDAMAMRGFEKDEAWTPEQGSLQKTRTGLVYEGTILEHLLIQNLTAFYEVGKHNIIRLRGADWNDALDMAPDQGESVAFTFAYAENLKELANMISLLKEKGTDRFKLAAETARLLCGRPSFYEDPEKKQEMLKEYAQAVRHQLSGGSVLVSADELIRDLQAKADHLFELLRRQEYLDEGWYNSYYDNHARRVEGIFQNEKGENQVRMMLTGQVFAIRSGVATDEQVKSIADCADQYLFDPNAGGYRLNTNFHELKMDMGRMFGFAYGEKENGAVFSHMTVMYASALYSRGFAKEGFKALQTLADQANCFEKSRIYPGLPEYFDQTGRGVYHYLTGSASWYLLTVLTQQYGIQGNLGDLALKPQLLANQFDENGKASVSLYFAGKKLQVVYENPDHKEHYQVREVTLNGEKTENVIPRSLIEALPEEGGVIKAILN
ncbi:MAG: cellobiose phosphorylase [Firmicutes bacterium]|nr:cellobiose phosphorylase [Bacillota bacterium]